MGLGLGLGLGVGLDLQPHLHAACYGRAVLVGAAWLCAAAPVDGTVKAHAVARVQKRRRHLPRRRRRTGT